MAIISKVILRDQEQRFINGYDGGIERDRLFDFTYSKEDVIFILIDGKEYEEASTAFDFVQVKLPSQKEMYSLIDNLVRNVVDYRDYSKQIALMTEMVTNAEGRAIDLYKSMKRK